MHYIGKLRKMQTQLDSPVKYRLMLTEQAIDMNLLLGKFILIEFTGTIQCIHCDRKIKKSFNQGYCYVCFKALAECDQCIMRPELCHFDQGTCRDEPWALAHCMQPHYVYLANSSGLKVGITRQTQIPTRWIDQGAVQAVAIAKVKNRLHSGLIEVILKKYVSDRTNWRQMLKGSPSTIDMATQGRDLCAQLMDEITEDQSLQSSALELQDVNQITGIDYPVIEYPKTIRSYNLDKVATINAVLLGIKGQYLLFDGGVINLRKIWRYEISLSVGND